MNTKKLLCMLAIFTMLFSLAGCGIERLPENEYGIPAPDLTTEYVESGFVEYYGYGAYGTLPDGSVSVRTKLGFRTLRVADGAAKRITVTLFFGGGAHEDNPFTHVEIALSAREAVLPIKTILKEDYLTKDYEINVEEIDHRESKFTKEKIEYTHYEDVTIPMTFFSEDKGYVCFSAVGYVGEDRCYDGCYRSLYYSKENGKIHFMSEREYVYSTKGALRYWE